MPYELVGIIASSAPDGVALERVHVRRSKVGGPDLRLVMEGNCEGQEATTAFRGWMEQLKDATPLSRIENLRFERAGHNLAFYLDASTEEGQP